MPRRRATPPDCALITGASSGIGAALAASFARRGHDLVLTARRGDRLKALAKTLSDAHGVSVRCISADLEDPKTAAKLFAATEGAGRPIGVLVNNAGFGAFKPFLKTPLDDVLGMAAVNMRALTELTHRFGAAMAQRREGRILNVASIAAFAPTPTAAVYGATKAYVLSLSEALSVELGARGVTVTALCPGLTETEFFTRAAGRKSARFALPLAVADAASVAEAGYAAAMAGEAVRVPGLLNALGAEAMRLAPRPLARMAGAFAGRQLIGH